MHAPVATLQRAEAPLLVDLGCGTNCPPGFVGVDRVAGDGVAIVHDLAESLPFADDSVALLRAYDIIEHLPDRLRTMNELWRVLIPDGVADILVPSTDGRGAFQDPTHVSYWNRNSFAYYAVDGGELYALGRRYGFRGGFRVESLEEVMWGPGIVHTHVRLRAVKPCL